MTGHCGILWPVRTMEPEPLGEHHDTEPGAPVALESS